MVLLVETNYLNFILNVSFPTKNLGNVWIFILIFNENSTIFSIWGNFYQIFYVTKMKMFLKNKKPMFETMYQFL
jgi:hypothetical protein